MTFSAKACRRTLIFRLYWWIRHITETTDYFFTNSFIELLSLGKVVVCDRGTPRGDPDISLWNAVCPTLIDEMEDEQGAEEQDDLEEVDFYQYLL